MIFLTNDLDPKSTDFFLHAQPLLAQQPSCRPRGDQEEGDHGRERKQCQQLKRA